MSSAGRIREGRRPPVGHIPADSDRRSPAQLEPIGRSGGSSGDRAPPTGVSTPKLTTNDTSVSSFHQKTDTLIGLNSLCASILGEIVVHGFGAAVPRVVVVDYDYASFHYAPK